MSRNPPRRSRKALPAEPAQPEAFVLPLQLAQAFLNYLSSRPYAEVFQLVQAVQGLRPLDADQIASLDGEVVEDDDTEE